MRRDFFTSIHRRVDVPATSWNSRILGRYLTAPKKNIPRITLVVSSARQLVVLAILTALVAGCEPQTPQATASPRNGTLLLKGAGATFPSLLYNQWFATS